MYLCTYMHIHAHCWIRIWIFLMGSLILIQLIESSAFHSLPQLNLFSPMFSPCDAVNINFFKGQSFSQHTLESKAQQNHIHTGSFINMKLLVIQALWPTYISFHGPHMECLQQILDPTLLPVSDAFGLPIHTYLCVCSESQTSSPSSSHFSLPRVYFLS